MQAAIRRSNEDRTAATRAQLVSAARSLFAERPYADTGTPEIVAAAGLTRGALYHHFADKQALFRAVVEAEAAAVAADIDRASWPAGDPMQAIALGSTAYFEAMAKPGRTRLLLLDGPAVLGRTAMDAIDAVHGSGGTLRAGLAAALGMPDLSVAPLADLLSAAFDRAVLAIEAGGDAGTYHAAIDALLGGLLRR